MPAGVRNSSAAPPLPDLILDQEKVHEALDGAGHDFTVDRLDSHVVDVIFHMNNASALLRLKDILEDDDVSYGIRGGLYTQGAFGTKKLKIEKMGRINLKEPRRSDGSAMMLSP